MSSRKGKASKKGKKTKRTRGDAEAVSGTKSRQKPSSAVRAREEPEVDFEDDFDDEVHEDDDLLQQLIDEAGQDDGDDDEMKGKLAADEEDDLVGDFKFVHVEPKPGEGFSEEEDSEEEEHDSDDDDEPANAKKKAAAKQDFALDGGDSDDEELAPAPAAAAPTKAEDDTAAKKRAKNKKKKERARKKKKEEKKAKEPKPAFRPGVHKLGEGEELDYDSSVYHMFHRLNVTWPCLSFDIIRDTLGERRSKFPHTMYMTTGTQAAAGSGKNSVKIMKISDLHKTQHDDESDPDDDDEDLDDDPVIEEKLFLHPGAVNRIRHCNQKPGFIATQADTGRLHIWDARALLSALDKPGGKLPSMRASHTFNQNVEGFALDWSPKLTGHLISGDCHGNICLHEPNEGMTAWTSKAMGKSSFAHRDSVEDLQWCPDDEKVFASCSVDKTIRIWDLRLKPSEQKSWVAAHSADVNVISWNRLQTNLIVSGSDDGSFKIWDRRNFTSKNTIGHFKHHKGHITSVEWHPHDETTLAVSGSDDMISIWDLSLERDPEATLEAEEKSVQDLPPQLLFEHLGQRNIKELHFHPQIPNLIISTAETGFHLFQPENLEEVKPTKPAKK